MIKKIKKLDIKNPIIIEGLPGMGNVGKIAVDFMVDSLKAVKFCDITSDNFPHCVFVNDDNLIEMPKISLYHKKIKGNSFVFVVGDIQPVNEEGCFVFCREVLGIFKGVKEIVTLGGIGLESIPMNPKLFCTGTDKKVVTKYKLPKARGQVGPVIGVSGVLVGLGEGLNIPGVIILSQTFAHPTYLGVKGAREMLKKVNSVWKLGLDIRSLDKEVKEIEKEIKEKVEKVLMLKEDKKSKDHMSYIG